MESAESDHLSSECVYFRIKLKILGQDLRLEFVSSRHPGSIKNCQRVLQLTALPGGCVLGQYEQTEVSLPHGGPVAYARPSFSWWQVGAGIWPWHQLPLFASDILL